MKKLPNIHAILFDFVGVLMRTIDVPPDPVVDAINRMIGSVTDDEKFKKEAQAKYNLTSVQFEEYLDKIVNRFEPFSPLWEMIPQLNKIYKLAIINNGTALTLPRFISRFPELKTQFDVFVSSAKEGVKKPDSEIYFRTCRKIGIKPVSCLYLDDDKYNIDAANNLGIQSIWWNTYEKGYSDFSNYLRSH